MTTLRRFLKSVGAIIVLPASAKPVDAVELAVINIPPPIEKMAVFKVGDWCVRMMVTDQILIQLEDGTFSLNPYRTWFKVIAECTQGPVNGGYSVVKMWRFEGKTISREDVPAQWIIDARKIVRTLREHPDDPSLLLCNQPYMMPRKTII